MVERFHGPYWYFSSFFNLVGDVSFFVSKTPLFLPLNCTTIFTFSSTRNFSWISGQISLCLFIWLRHSWEKWGITGEIDIKNFEKKSDICIQSDTILEYKDDLFLKKKPTKCKISIFLNLDNKLINLNMNNDYSLKSYKQLDLLKNSKKLDYNLDISWIFRILSLIAKKNLAHRKNRCFSFCGG